MFVFTSPGNVAFSLFGLDIYYYGILMGAAICTAIILSNYIANKFYGYNNLILDISPSILLWGILGARLYYCVLNHGYYFSHPLDILAVRNGGLSIHGALIGGAAALWFECKRRGIKFSQICDIFVYSLPLAQAVARWGNFFNSEAFGLPANLPWKLFIPLQNRPVEYINYSYFHPTFLYESILDLVIFFVLLILLKRRNNFSSGSIAAIYLILYSCARIFVELFRVDAAQSILNIPVPIVVSVIIIFTASIYLIKKRV